MTDPIDDQPTTGLRDDTQPPAMPRWVKVSMIVVGALLLVFVVLKLTGAGGQHGPGLHQRSQGLASVVTPATELVDAGR